MTQQYNTRQMFKHLLVAGGILLVGPKVVQAQGWTLSVEPNGTTVSGDQKLAWGRYPILEDTKMLAAQPWTKGTQCIVSPGFRVKEVGSTEGCYILKARWRASLSNTVPPPDVVRVRYKYTATASGNYWQPNTLWSSDFKPSTINLKI